MKNPSMEETEMFLALYGLLHIKEYDPDNISEASCPIEPIEIDGKIYYPRKNDEENTNE